MIGVPLGIVGADEVDLVAAHSLVTDPDISLDVLQHMARWIRPLAYGSAHVTRIFFAT